MLAYVYPTRHGSVKTTRLRNGVRVAARDWAKSVSVTLPHVDVADFRVRVDSVVAGDVERWLHAEGFVVVGQGFDPYGPRYDFYVRFPPDSRLGTASAECRAMNEKRKTNPARYVVVQYAAKRHQKGEVVSAPLVMGEAKRKATLLRGKHPEADFRIERAP